jgi:hypothetical protein
MKLARERERRFSSLSWLFLTGVMHLPPQSSFLKCPQRARLAKFDSPKKLGARGAKEAELGKSYLTGLKQKPNFFSKTYGFAPIHWVRNPVS